MANYGKNRYKVTKTAFITREIVAESKEEAEKKMKEMTFNTGEMAVGHIDAGTRQLEGPPKNDQGELICGRLIDDRDSLNGKKKRPCKNRVSKPYEKCYLHLD